MGMESFTKCVYRCDACKCVRENQLDDDSLPNEWQWKPDMLSELPADAEEKLFCPDCWQVIKLACTKGKNAFKAEKKAVRRGKR